MELLKLVASITLCKQASTRLNRNIVEEFFLGSTNSRLAHWGKSVVHIQLHIHINQESKSDLLAIDEKVAYKQRQRPQTLAL